MRLDLVGVYGKVGYREGGGRVEEEGERSHQENERKATQRQLVKQSVSGALSREIRLTGPGAEVELSRSQWLQLDLSNLEPEGWKVLQRMK